MHTCLSPDIDKDIEIDEDKFCCAANMESELAVLIGVMSSNDPS